MDLEECHVCNDKRLVGELRTQQLKRYEHYNGFILQASQELARTR